jgi:transposase-like protein
MSEERQERRFSREFKLSALARMEAGANVSALSRELSVPRKCLYQWRERFRLGGPVALRSRGRPTKVEVAAMRGGDVPAELLSLPMPPRAGTDALAQAQARIAELERKIGQQELDLDFFQQALRHVEEAQRRSGAPGGTGSTRSPRR